MEEGKFSPANSQNLLSVNGLSVKLDHRTIFSRLSFSLGEGAIVCIIGPNGSGKTVLLKCLLGLLPYSGKISWKNEIKIGYVPQRLPFIKKIPLTVYDFFHLKNNSRAEILHILHAVGFEDSILYRSIGDLSSGQFQRVLIAWSLVGQPEVLLFDEPTTGIDIGGEETIYHLLKKLKNEKWYLAMLLVTHDLNIVYEFCDYVICLSQKTICMGKPNEVLTPETIEEMYGGKVKFYKHKE